MCSLWWRKGRDIDQLTDYKPWTIKVEDRKIYVCVVWICIQSLACLPIGDGHRGHRVDGGCSWLGWEDRAWELGTVETARKVT